MSWAGHAFDMIARIKYNESLRKSYRYRHSKIKNAFFNEYTRRNSPLINSRDIPKDEAARIKSEVRRRFIKERRIALAKSLSITIILISVMLYILFKYLLPGIESYFNR